MVEHLTLGQLRGIGHAEFHDGRISVSDAGLGDHRRAEVETEPTGRLECGQQVTGTAAEFKHTSARRDMMTEVGQQLGVETPLGATCAGVVSGDPVEVSDQGGLGGVNFRR